MSGAAHSFGAGWMTGVCMRSFFGGIGFALMASASAAFAAPLPADNLGYASPYMGVLEAEGFVTTDDSFKSIRSVSSSSNPGGSGFTVFSSFDVVGNVGPLVAGGVLIRRDDTQPLGTVTAGIYNYSASAANNVGSLIASLAPPSGGFVSSFESSLFTLAAGSYVFQVHASNPNGVSLYRLNVSTVPVPGAAILFAAGLGAVGLAGRRRSRTRKAVQAI